MIGSDHIPAADDFGPAWAILKIATEPVANAARLKELAEKSAEVRALLEQATAASADLDAKREEHEAKLAAELTEHERTMSVERTAHEATMTAREKALELQEARVAALEHAAQAAIDAAAASREDFQRRALAMREVARLAAAA